ncbi:abortive infection protein [Calothrix brevissima NIES-22]|nr:abortive infection protein [Calothrix brevissima NIES-22]
MYGFTSLLIQINMNKRFLDAVHQGDNHWWHYCLAVFLIVYYWVNISGYIVLICQSLLSLIISSDSIVFFISTSTAFIALLLILIFIVQRLHRRSFYSLISTDASIDKKRLLLGFGVWLIQLFIFTFSDISIHPQDYLYKFDPQQWFLLLPFALILTPIQTSAEEFLFRGYLMQGLSLITKHRLLLILITSFLFTIPHLGNPEMQRGFILGAMSYFVWGIFLAAITLKDNGLELALGVHAANNLFSFLIMRAQDSVIPNPTIFVFARAINAQEGLISLLINAGIFYAVFFGGIARKPKSN